MENIKKRKIEETSINIDVQNILDNQEKMISYIYQIGSICESTLHTLGNINEKMKELNERIIQFEIKNNYLEHSINKINHNFIQELKHKDLEINSLKELNKNITEEYNALIQYQSNNINDKKDNSSFYL